MEVSYETAGEIEEPRKDGSPLGVPSLEEIWNAQEKECTEELRLARNSRGKHAS